MEEEEEGVRKREREEIKVDREGEGWRRRKRLGAKPFQQYCHIEAGRMVLGSLLSTPTS